MPPAKCSHRDLVNDDVKPITPEGCQECMKLDQGWEHLRMCMTCGYVGCCDSSPGHHASQHAAESGHPVVRSWQPGEKWAWCFEDGAYLFDLPLEPVPATFGSWIHQRVRDWSGPM